MTVNMNGKGVEQSNHAVIYVVILAFACRDWERNKEPR